MTNGAFPPTQAEAAAPERIDERFAPDRLRISPDYGSLGVKKALITVPVRKPDKQWFVRVHPDEGWRLPVNTIEIKEDREIYIVDPAVATQLGAEVTPMMLFTALTRHGVVFLWPIRLPGEDGKHNEWHRAAMEAAQRAQIRWVRVVANMSVGAYDVFEATGALPDPEWPDVSFGELLKVAFKDHFIEALDHPVLRRLRGEL
jgi:hypothetical protein